LKNTNKTDLVILAGGYGSRIKSFLKGNPKPLMKIRNFDFLSLLIKKFSRYDLNKIFILAGYRGKKIKEKFHNKFFNLIKIECIIEKNPLGTGGCLNQIKNKLSKNFIVTNGDTYFDIDLNKVLDYDLKNKNLLISLVENNNYKSNKKLTKIGIAKNKIIFNKKSNLINGGIYKLDKSIFKYIKGKCSLEEDVLPEMIKSGKVNGLVFDDFFIDIGTPKNLIYAKKKLVRYLNKPALFLDRDGTLNHDKGYTYKEKELKFLPGVISRLQKLSKKKIYIFIVTNQAGIGKGYFTINQFYKFQKLMKTKFAEKKIFIDEVFFCPFHPKAKLKQFRKITGYRKPGNLMIKQAFKNWPIVKNKSMMIGDKKSDFLCAKKSGIKFVYTKNNFEDLLNEINF